MATFMHMNPQPEQALSLMQIANSNSHEAVNNIWQYPFSILFKQLPLDRPPEGRSAHTTIDMHAKSSSHGKAL